MFNFQDRYRTKLRAHVLVDSDQILVMKSDYDFGSVNEALRLGPSRPFYKVPIFLEV